MKITNVHNLPAAIVEAITNDPYNRGDSDISVTGLLQPPRKGALDLLHYDELVEDASGRIWALLGQAIHTILERSDQEALSERLFAKIAGWTVSGLTDSLVVMEEADAWAITDYKVTSSYRIKAFNPADSDYTAQLNLYALLLREAGFKVGRLEIVALMRDWSKLEAVRQYGAAPYRAVALVAAAGGVTREAENEAAAPTPTPEWKPGRYPPAQVVRLDVPLWPDQKAIAYAEHRVKIHQAARAEGAELPECDDEERWAKSAKWAVMKEGRRSALRVLNSNGGAMAWAAHEGLGMLAAGEFVPASGISIAYRPGASVRCADYCSAAPWCTQWQAIRKGLEETSG